MLVDITPTLFPSLEAAKEAAQQRALQAGFFINSRRSKKDRQGLIRKLWLKCVFGGTFDTRYNPNVERLKERSTRCIECPWIATISRQTLESWELTTVTALHNHGATDLRVIPEARAALRPSDFEKTVNNLSAAGSRPQVILAALKQQDPNCVVIPRDIYNLRSAAATADLNGRTDIEALLDDLVEQRLYHQYQRDPSQRLTHLLFSPATAVDLAKSHRSIILMDATYRTNGYNMPLLHVVGVSATNQSFTVCFIFMTRETEEDYDWAVAALLKLYGDVPFPPVVVTDRELALMQALENIVPWSTNILCIWHINKNILQKCLPCFPLREDYTTFVSAWYEVRRGCDKTDSSNAHKRRVIHNKNDLYFVTTQVVHSDDVEQTWEAFAQQYASQPLCVDYLASTWLIHQTKFFRKWTNHVRHYGHLSTSRVEGAHAQLKSWLQSSKATLRMASKGLLLASEAQNLAIRYQIEFETTRSLVSLAGNPLWTLLDRKISHAALKLLLEQKKLIARMLAMEEHPPCTGTFRQTMGLPCAHDMLEMKKLSQPLPLNTVDQRWMLAYVQQPLEVQQGSILEATLRQVEGRHNDLLPHQREMFMGDLQALGQRSDLYQVLAPPVVRSKGRPKGALNKKRRLTESSTARDPSAFEYVDFEASQTTKERKPITCGACGGKGHNRRSGSCPKNTLSLLTIG